MTWLVPCRGDPQLGAGRLSQTVDGNTVEYTLDLAGSLSQVLWDGNYKYLYGLQRIAQSYTGGRDYFIGDALNNVRQMVTPENVLTLSRNYEPYGTAYSAMGSRSTSYGFTGEWVDGTGLVNLRARYYMPSSGRFITRDTWKSNINTQSSYNLWIYGYSNPIKYIDPTGLYSDNVHRDLTKELALRAGHAWCIGLACGFVDQIAEIIANGDYNVDHSKLLQPLPVVGHPELHFKPSYIADRNAKEAINIDDPYLLGSSLHQVQDFYCHWNEGYRYPEGNGHFNDSFIAGCIPSIGCYRNSILIVEFYTKHPDALSKLRNKYTDEKVNRITYDKLIDLYLYTFTKPGDSARGKYGYDTDHYFGFTQKDIDMRFATLRYLSNFFVGNSIIRQCDMDILIPIYTKSSDEEVLDFLTNGSK